MLARESAMSSTHAPPSIENLRCFEAAARLLNFRAAARAVALTPAAFGQRIRQLEEGLGVRLFERSTRAVRLTERGLALLPAARACLAAAEGCVAAARSEGPAPIEMVLGTRFELGMSWIVPLLDRIAADHPHVTLDLFFGSGPELLARLRGLTLDAVITSARVRGAAFEALNLHRESYVFVGAPGLLARRPLARAEDAGGHTLLDVDDELPLFRYFAEAPGAPGPLHFGAVRYLGLGAAVRARALGGHGVAVLPRYLVEEDLAGGRLAVIFPEALLLSDHFRLVFRRGDPRRGAFEGVAGTLRGAPIR